jgi:serine/threonine protein kinase
MLNKTRRRGGVRGRSETRRKTLRNKINCKRSKSCNIKKISQEEIGFGGFGIVSRPPARCDTFINKNFNQNAFREAYYGNRDYVSKLTEYSSADRELVIGNVIKDKIDDYQNYFCLVEFICNAPREKSIERNGDFYGTYAISPYCGIPLDEFLLKDINAPVNIFELCYLVRALQILTYGITELHKNHIFHKDIHPGNILWDNSSGLMRLIDFGLADDLSDLNASRLGVMYDKVHDLEMLIKNVIHPLIDILLDSRINDSRLWAKKEFFIIEDFYYEIRDFYGKMERLFNPHGSRRYNQLEMKDRKIQITRLSNIIDEFMKIKSLDELTNLYVVNNNNVNKNNINLMRRT